MEMNEYQTKATSTAIYPQRGFNPIYPVLGLNGEAGEVAEIIKKVIRDGDGWVDEDARDDLLYELGDCLWYISAICDELGFDLNDVAQANLDKLADRQRRDRLNGSGDKR